MTFTGKSILKEGLSKVCIYVSEETHVLNVWYVHLIGKAKQSQDIYLIHYDLKTELSFSITEFNHVGSGLRSSVVQPAAQGRVDLSLDEAIQGFIQLCPENLQGQTEPIQHLWKAWLSSWRNSFFSYIVGTSLFSIDAHCFLSSHYVLLWGVWFWLLSNLLVGTGRLLWASPKAISSPDWTSPASSASPHRASTSAPKHLHVPPQNSLHFINVCLVLETPNQSMVLSLWYEECWVEEDNPFPQFPGYIPVNTAQNTADVFIFPIFSFFCPPPWLGHTACSCSACCLLRSLFTELLPSQSVPSLYHCKGLLLPMG